MGIKAIGEKMIEIMELDIESTQKKLDEMTEEEKNKLANEEQIKYLQNIFANKKTATFLTQADLFTIALLLAKREVIEMKKRVEAQK